MGDICRWVRCDLHGGGGDDLRVPDAAFLEFPRHLTVGARAAERGDTAVVSNGALRGREKGRTHSILIIRYTVYLLNIICNITSLYRDRRITIQYRLFLKMNSTGDVVRAAEY